MVGLITAVFAFFADFFKKYIVDSALRISSVVTIISINTMFFVSFLASLFAIANILFFFYKKINELFSYIDSLISNSGNDILNVAFKILSNFGFFKAFNDILNLFSPVLISIFVYYFSKLLVVALFHIRNSILSVIISAK